MPVLPAVPSTIVPAGPQQTPGAGVLNEAQRRAVLDRLAGVQELGLAEDVAARRLGCGAQPDQGRVADQVDDGGGGHGRRLGFGASLIEILYVEENPVIPSTYDGPNRPASKTLMADTEDKKAAPGI
jgi:hypothetical protein